MITLKRFFSYLTVILMVFSILPGGRTPLVMAVPTDNAFMLTAEGRCGYVALEWTPVEGAQRYYIYRGIGEGGQHAMPLTDFPITSTAFNDGNDIEEGVQYCYFIRAIGEDNREFLQSVEACAVPTCPSSNPCAEEPLEVERLSLKYQVGSKLYWVNEEEKGPMEAAPEIRWQRMFLVIRFVTQEVGAEIGWEGETRTVTIVTAAGNTLEFQIDNPKYKLNGEEDWVDPNNTEVAPYILAGRTMIPLRRVGEALDAEDIIWHGDTSTAELLFAGDDCEALCPYPVYARAEAENYDLVSNCDMRYMGRKEGNDFILRKKPGRMSVVPYPDYLDVDDDGDALLNIMELAKSGACMMYATTSGVWRWPMPNTSTESSVYRHKFCTPEPKEIEMVGYSWGGGVTILNDPPVVSAMPASQIQPHYNNEILLHREESGLFHFTFTVPAGTHFLYFIHQINEGKPAGLIYGGIFHPIEEEIIECDWTPKGKIVSTRFDESDGAWIINFLTCDDETLLLQTPEDLLDTLGTYPISQAIDFCARLCFNQEHLQIIAWEILPDDPCCPKEEEEEPDQLICGCIVRLTLDPDEDNMHQVYIKENCYLGSPMYDITLHVPTDLLDSEHGLHIVDYFLLYEEDERYKKDTVCIEMQYNSDLQVTQWWAYPDKDPCCPQAPEECRWIEQGYLISIEEMMMDDTEYWMIEFMDCDEIMYEYALFTHPNEFFAANALGVPISQVGRACVQFCIKPGIKDIHPDHEVIAWKWIDDDCCPQPDVSKGRIQITVPDEYIEGTKVNIYDEAGKLVWQGHPDDEGIFDTECILPCPGTYIVSPIHERYLFEPEKKTITLSEEDCCDEVIHELFFDCACTWTINGRINSQRGSFRFRGCDDNWIAGDYGERDPTTFMARNDPNFSIQLASDIRICIRLCLIGQDPETVLIAWEVMPEPCCEEAEEAFYYQSMRQTTSIFGQWLRMFNHLTS